MKILMVMAHPDDEVIFGWPVIQKIEPDTQVALLTISHNRARHGEGPIEAVREVCKHNNIRWVDDEQIENNFYRIPPRFESYVLQHAIDSITARINRAINTFHPDVIFTHNPMGEYGHGDHRFLFSLMTQYQSHKLITDICFYNRCHLSTPRMPATWIWFYSMATLGSTPYRLDVGWYEAMRKIYRCRKAWSWSGGLDSTLQSCNVYRIA